jgi:hypothetical protein
MAEPDQTDQVEQHENSDAKLPWVTPAIIRSSARQAKKAGGDYDNDYSNPGFLS